MSAPLSASIILACMLCGMALGSYLRLVLPDDHTQADSKDILMTSAGMMATLIALIIGLLVTSAKGNYDDTTSSLTQGGAKVITVDYYLSHYGPEAKETRDFCVRRSPPESTESGQTKARKGPIWRRWKWPPEWLTFTTRFANFHRKTTHKNIFKLRPCKSLPT